MEYLQYIYILRLRKRSQTPRFKPCYKWNTFNTRRLNHYTYVQVNVLNLVINGIPSIQLQRVQRRTK